MEAPSWELGEIGSKLSPQVKYYVLQMGVTVFEEADLVFCCSTSQKMKRKTSLLALQDTGVAFASFPEPVADTAWCLLECPPSPYQQRGKSRDEPGLSLTCLLLEYSQQTERWDRSQGCHHPGHTLACQRLHLLPLQLKNRMIGGDLLPGWELGPQGLVLGSGSPSFVSLWLKTHRLIGQRHENPPQLCSLPLKGVWMNNMPEVTHASAEKFTFNQHLSLPPSTYENLLGKITVNQVTKILSCSSSLLSQIKDLFCAVTADKHCALYFRSSLLELLLPICLGPLSKEAAHLIAHGGRCLPLICLSSFSLQ